MGHSRLGTMPDTAPFRRVIGIITDGGSVAAIAKATILAALRGLELAKNDEGLKQTFWLLSQIVLASRQADLPAELRQLGMTVPNNFTTLNIVAGLTQSIDDHLRETRSRSDIGEMAQMAAAEALTSTLSTRLKTLFDTTSGDVQQAIRGSSTLVGFSELAHSFFASFTQRFLTYHLSRELANHVGKGKRFASPIEHTEFVDQLSLHCKQAALIVKQYAGDWYSKTKFVEGSITPTKVRKFLHVAIDKLEHEMMIRGNRDG